jgi:hypothetical protein
VIFEFVKKGLGTMMFLMFQNLTQLPRERFSFLLILQKVLGRYSFVAANMVTIGRVGMAIVWKAWRIGVFHRVMTISSS